MVGLSIKFTKHAKRQKETQSEKTIKMSVPDSYMMLVWELTDMEIKIIMTNMLRTLI